MDVNRKICFVISIFQLLCLHYLFKVNNGAPSVSPLYPNGYSDSCDAPSFGCFDGTCLPIEWVCDGNEDCLDGEDEFCINAEPAETYDLKPENFQPKKRSSSLSREDKDRRSLEDEALSLIHEANLALNKEKSFVSNQKISQKEKKVLKRDNLAASVTDQNSVTTAPGFPNSTPTHAKSYLKFFTSILNTEVVTHPSSTIRSSTAFNFPPIHPLIPLTPTNLQNTITTASSDIILTSVINTTLDNISVTPWQTDAAGNASEPTYNGVLDRTLIAGTDKPLSETTSTTFSDMSSSDIFSNIISTRPTNTNPTTTTAEGDLDSSTNYEASTDDITDINSATNTSGYIFTDVTSNTFTESDETTAETFSTSGISKSSTTEISLTSSHVNFSDSANKTTSGELTSMSTSLLPDTTTQHSLETSESPEITPETDDPQSKVKKLIKITKDLLDIKKYFEDIHLKVVNSTTNCSKDNEISGQNIYKDPRVISKATCPYHFQFMRDICVYAQIYPPVSWYEATAICSAQNGILLSITSKPFFEKLLKQLNFDRMRIYDFWIGATNANEDSEWRWADGKAVTNFDIWGFNLLEKNIKLVQGYNQAQNCAFLDGKLYSYINEDNCFVPKGFICQTFPYSGSHLHL